VARIVPSDIARLELAGANRHEIETLHLLQARLPDGCTVFHGVHWTREWPGETIFGELDFVVVNRAGKALLIEQKDGTLEETPDGLIAHYADRSKNVVDQVQRALDNVRDKFRRAEGGRAIELDYLIYCPFHRLMGINAAALDPSRVVDATQRAQLPERIEACLGPGDPDREAWAETVRGFFRQTFEVVPDIHAHVTGQEKAFTRLSGGLVRWLAGLEMDPLRLRLYGTAGSGKTQIARHFFDEALRRGRRPLLVCFNRPLSERLKVVVRPGGLVVTFNGLCARFLEERGQRLDFDEMKRDPRFWEKVSERVIAEAVPDHWKFDTLIVDEGQDFEPVWADILELFLRDPHDVLWLEDPDQNLRDQPRVALPGFVGYRARMNYRSPQSIARFILRALPFDFEAVNELPGLGVGVTPYDAPGDQPRLVARIIGDLLRRGFTHGQIVVLTTLHVVTPGAPRSVLDGSARVGNYRLRRFTGEYDLLGNQLTTPGQITFDSVGRFKGQESPAVILVDVDPDPAEQERADRLLFAGMTRATVRLEMVMRSGNPLNQRFGSP
jgi:hypothetical protein